METDEIALSVRDIHKTFGENKVLKGFPLMLVPAM